MRKELLSEPKVIEEIAKDPGVDQAHQSFGPFANVVMPVAVMGGIATLCSGCESQTTGQEVPIVAGGQLFSEEPATEGLFEAKVINKEKISGLGLNVAEVYMVETTKGTYFEKVSINPASDIFIKTEVENLSTVNDLLGYNLQIQSGTTNAGRAFIRISQIPNSMTLDEFCGIKKNLISEAVFEDFLADVQTLLNNKMGHLDINDQNLLIRLDPTGKQVRIYLIDWAFSYESKPIPLEKSAMAPKLTYLRRKYVDGYPHNEALRLANENPNPFSRISPDQSAAINQQAAASDSGETGIQEAAGSSIVLTGQEAAAILSSLNRSGVFIEGLDANRFPTEFYPQLYRLTEKLYGPEAAEAIKNGVAANDVSSLEMKVQNLVSVFFLIVSLHYEVTTTQAGMDVYPNHQPFINRFGATFMKRCMESAPEWIGFKKTVSNLHGVTNRWQQSHNAAVKYNFEMYGPLGAIETRKNWKDHSVAFTAGGFSLPMRAYLLNDNIMTTGLNGQEMLLIAPKKVYDPANHEPIKYSFMTVKFDGQRWNVIGGSNQLTFEWMVTDPNGDEIKLPMVAELSPDGKTVVVKVSVWSLPENFTLMDVNP